MSVPGAVYYSSLYLEVLIVVEESWALKSVGSSTSGLHSIGHPRWATGEHSNLWQKNIVLLETVKELVEVWPAKVSNSSQPGEQTATRQLLEVALTDVLEKRY